MSTMLEEKVCQLDIHRSFRVCGITTNDLGKARNDEFLKKIMNPVKGKLADEEEPLEDEDPF